MEETHLQSAVPMISGECGNERPNKGAIRQIKFLQEGSYSDEELMGPTELLYQH